MKTNIIKTSLIACAVVALAFTASAADPVKGGERQLNLLGIKTKAEADALKPGDSIAMVCTKCKTVTIERVTVEKGPIKTVTPGEKHLCTGCNTSIKVVGTGKGAKDEVKHVCEGSPESSTVIGWSLSAAHFAPKLSRRIRTLTFGALKHSNSCVTPNRARR